MNSKQIETIDWAIGFLTGATDIIDNFPDATSLKKSSEVMHEVIERLKEIK
jgi:hypothetical protein